MARHTDDTAHEHISTDAVSSGHGRMKRLIIALTVLACILIGAFALYAISFLFSRTVGVHPIVALLALVAGAELFGLLGGFLSPPVAGVLQQIIVAVWHRWEQKHPDQFPLEEVPPQQSAPVPGQEVAPTDTAPSSRKS